jgi:hypothetical protein
MIYSKIVIASLVCKTLLRGECMNKTMKSLMVVGIGATAYGLMSRNNGMNRRMKKGMKRVTKAIF